MEGPGLLPKASLEPDEHVSVHPALRDANLTGDEIRPLRLVGDQLCRVFAPDWHRLGKRLLTSTTTGPSPAPRTLPERRLITNGAGRQDVPNDELAFYSINTLIEFNLNQSLPSRFGAIKLKFFTSKYHLPIVWITFKRCT